MDVVLTVEPSLPAWLIDTGSRSSKITISLTVSNFDIYRKTQTLGSATTCSNQPQKPRQFSVGQIRRFVRYLDIEQCLPDLIVDGFLGHLHRQNTTDKTYIACIRDHKPAPRLVVIIQHKTGRGRRPHWFCGRVSSLHPPWKSLTQSARQKKRKVAAVPYGAVENVRKSPM